MPPILTAPLKFNGSLEEFYNNYGRHVLIPPEWVEEFHSQFVKYYETLDPLYLIRQVSKQVRGEIVRTENGSQIRWTDNSPAWWIHYQLITGQFNKRIVFDDFIKSIPSHMFRINIKGHINQSGWHVAHLFDVKNRDTNFQQWTKRELLKRTALSIHPCNYFYIANDRKNGNKFGGDKNFQSFFYEKFQSYYSGVWDDFLNLIGESPIERQKDGKEIYYEYSNTMKSKVQKKFQIEQNITPQKPDEYNIGCKVYYHFSRLCFKADLIEPLDWDDYFCIFINGEVYKMTKKEFYENFPNVVRSKSYLERGIYHYPTTPRKAEKFKI
ncbi:MAG: hypothetical protein ACYDH1_17840 [Anaerolineaceae bacterium]